jgi:hypothetical protein
MYILGRQNVKVWNRNNLFKQATTVSFRKNGDMLSDSTKAGNCLTSCISSSNAILV